MTIFPSFFVNKTGGYEIEQSLRFNSADSYTFRRTPGSNSTSQKRFTVSAWVKRGVLATGTTGGSGRQGIFYTGLLSGSGNMFGLEWNDDGLACIFDGGGVYWPKTVAKFRDPSAWYHIVAAVDTAQATTADRFKLYVNRVEQTVTGTLPTLNFLVTNGTTSIHSLDGAGTRANQYIAELYYINDQQLTPDDFGEPNNEGVWIPKEYAGTFTGTNSCYLKFDPSATNGIGHDHSGNGNNFTTTNFTTSGTGTDVMSDTPTTNWCTLNSAANSPGTRTLSNGNLQADLTAAGGAKAVGTFLIPISGKWYWEMTANDSNSNQDTGVIQADSNFQIRDNTKFACYFPNGEYKIETAAQTSGFSTYTNGDIISIAVDADTNPPEIYFAKNNTWQNSAAPASGTNGLDLTVGKRYLPLLSHGSSGSSSSGIFNFGQRAFAYTPPTGYKALNTANLPGPDIADGSDNFNTVRYTGNASTQSITGVGFQPDLVWVKKRNGFQDHEIQDAVRGATKSLSSSLTRAETTDSQAITAFTSDGFNIGSSNSVNENRNYVAWNWLAANGTEALTAGSINSTVSANPTAGFSIVTYTGTGSAATVGHGLGVPPAFMVIKCRNKSFGWTIYHQSLGNTRHLDFTDGTGFTGDAWNSTNPTSTVFSIGTDAGSNNGSSPPNNYVAYCFAEVESYSKFGSYTANGSSDGPFVYCGFRPAFVMLKRTDGGTVDWQIKDAARDLYNPAKARLWPNSGNSEGSGTDMDFLSNGFKIRESGTATNSPSGGTWIYIAFAENPFGGSGVSPATAR